MTKSLYGGWVTFTAHLSKKYNYKLYKITKKTEKNRVRPFGYDINYQNLCMDDIKILPNIIITAIDKSYYEYLDFFPDKTKIVIHDPTEIKNKSIIEKLKRFEVITIRHTVHELLKTHGIDNIFLHHPFFDYPYNKEKNLTKNVSISRIDFDKNIDIILRSNLLLKTNKIDIYGAKNGLYVYHKLKNKLHLELDNYKGTFTKSFDELSSILKDVKFVIDMSSIKNDGGGTQYTFLEAIHHECVLILNSEWTNNLNTNFKHGYNCFIVSNEKELIEILNSDIDTSDILKNAKKMLDINTNSNWSF